MTVRFLIAAALGVFVGVALVVQQPLPALGQSPTEEPTKRPYVFATPVFIPTYPNDTSVPPPTRAAPNATPSLATTTATSQPQIGGQTYTVQSGDSLWIISQKVYGNGAKYSLIAEANSITTTTRLRTGMVLKIPGGTPAATVAPIATTIQVMPTLIVLPTPTGVATPSATPTKMAAASGFIPSSLVGPASIAINVVSAVLVLASFSSAVLAYLTYTRARRLRQIAEAKPPLRLG
jgi:LysM repeat protein